MHMPVGLPIAPTMAAIVVDRVPIVNPQITSIIGNDAPSVMARPEDSHASRPTHGEMVTSVKA
jgi:hypothetical protein